MALGHIPVRFRERRRKQSVNPRPSRTLLAKLVLLTALVGMLSCAPEKQHQVLSFFFDGVPPVGGSEQKKTKPTPGAPSVVTTEQPTAAAAGSEHKPTLDEKKCGACHSRQASFTLLRPVAELCVTCHADKTRQFPRTHGPVAVGECAECHEAHRSAHPHLLRKPAPQLCFQCHDRTAGGEKTLGCARPSDDVSCTNCHNPHGGKDRFFLASRSAENDPAPEAR